MTEVKYVSFMRSYYDAALIIQNPDDRLRFYDAILSYGFDDADTDFTDNPLLNSMFTLVKPFIDANKKRIMRNQINGSKHKSGLTHGISDGLLLDREIDKDTDNNKDTDIDTDKDTDTDNQKNDITTTYVHNFLIENKIDGYAESDIIKTINDYDLDINYLNFVLETVKTKYPKNSKKQNSAMFNQAYKWGDIIASYMDIQKETDTPIVCPECGGKLMTNGWGSKICPTCREKGIIHTWEYMNGHWQSESV